MEIDTPEMRKQHEFNELNRKQHGICVYIPVQAITGMDLQSKVVVLFALQRTTEFFDATVTNDIFVLDASLHFFLGYRNVNKLKACIILSFYPTTHEICLCPEPEWLRQQIR